ncbi:MAG: hypothetical protein RL492_1291 [Verrucomicrobiota bacterium]
MNNTLKTMLVAAAALTAVSAQAQDKATLDLLVKKGVISAEERAKTLDEAASARAASGVNRVFPKEDATKRFTIAGYFQTQMENFSYSQVATAGAASTSNYRAQNAFLMRRLYIEFIADVGEGIQGNVVFDMSGNTANSIDRAMVSHTSSIGTFDFGYKKVTWGYEESTLSSLFKASSSKLLTVERGITNRYWNEAENGSSTATNSLGRRLGFGAHHTGLHYTSVANPQGFEYGASVTAAAQGFNNFKGLNDVGGFANLVYNYKVSDNQKYAVGVNYGKVRYFSVAGASNTQANMEGYNPFVQAQYDNWTVYAEYLSTKINGTADVTNTAYKINDNWEAVARYTNLDTDGRGQAISDGVRDFGTVGGAGGAGISASNFNKSNSYYLGVNYYFTLPVAGGATVNGANAKIQLGYERSEFKDIVSGGVVTVAGAKANVDAIRLQAQVAF